MQTRTFSNPVTGEEAYVVKLSSETNGVCTIGEADFLPGGGPPAHYHRLFTETFTCLKGELHIRADKKIIVLEPGESFIIKPGVVHRPFNPTERSIRFRVEITPGFKGFEYMLPILFGLAADGKTNSKGIPTDFSALALLMDMGDTHFTGIASLMNPVIKFVAGRARKKGLEQQLIKKYQPAWYV
jgi:quercetin dioxygenase-like cupin family protein